MLFRTFQSKSREKILIITQVMIKKHVLLPMQTIYKGIFNVNLFKTTIFSIPRNITKLLNVFC